MTARRYHLVLALFIELIGFGGTAPAQAQGTERELALEMGRKGVELYNAQRFEDAFDKFQNAESLVHSPVFVLYIARIERRRGRWIAALGRYDTIVAETPPDDAPRAWHRARKEAELEGSGLADVIPELAIDTGPASPSAVKIWIDGKLVPDWSKRPLMVDPGNHAVAGKWGAHTAHARAQAVARNKQVEVRLPFPAPPPPIPKTPVSTVPIRPPMPDQTSSSQLTVGYGLLGAGGVAGLAALGVGIATLVHHGNFSELCVDDSCPRATEDDVALHTRLSRATLGLGVSSAALLVAGILVDLTAPAKRGPSVNAGGLTWRW